MRTASGQRVQIERQRRNERLSFTRRHFRDLAEVQLDAAHELHVVVHHVPLELLVRHGDLRADQAARSLARRGERLGQNLVEHFGDCVTKLCFDATATIRATQLVVDALALGRITRRPFRGLEARHFFLELVRPLTNDRAKLRRLATELLFGNSLETRVMLVDLVDDRLNASPFALVAGPEDLAQYAFQHGSSIGTARGR
jgi:hypothetical protein